MKNIRVALVALLTLCTAACGGGGDSVPAAVVAPGLLAGPEANAAIAALATTSTGPASAGEIELGHILTRIEIILDPAATIAQFNAAAATVGATSILSSETGSPGVTLEVPRQGSVGALNALVGRLDGKAGILFAMPARLFAVSVLPERSLGVPVGKTDLGHLLISRFPQAWNARGAPGADCLLHLVSSYVWDNFGQQSLRADFLSQVDGFSAAPEVAQLSDTDPVGGHGYDVALVLAAKFDATRPTGSLPFAECVLIHQVEAANRGMDEATNALKSALVAEGDDRFILNVSFGFPEPLCGALADTPCNTLTITATSAESVKRHIRQRVAAAVHWALQMRGLGLEPRMLITLAAGNVDADPDGFFENRYLGFRDAAYASPVSLATHLSELQAVLTNAVLWKSDVDANAPDATFTTAEAEAVVADVARYLGSSPDMPASNLVIVDSASCASAGSTSCGEEASSAARSDFNYQGGELRAVGEHVQFDGTQVTGTSFSAPQVAGLAAYLWTLSPPLKAEPVSTTIDFLKSTSRTAGTGTARLIDAYAATLQLDSIPTAEDRRIRSALMDANGDGNFDHLDLLFFRSAYQLSDPNRPDVPAARDFGRFDLNGDGLTGGISIASFDLDANGPAVISTVNKTIEGYPVTFNEAALSDLQILCFYAYSDLYARAPVNHAEALVERTSLLGESNCVGTRLSATLPAQVLTPTSLAVKVEVPAGGGQFAPAPNVLVQLTPTCASANPASGRTDANGALTTTISPVAGCTSLSVNVVARAEANTAQLARQTVTAQVGGARDFSGTITRTISGRNNIGSIFEGPESDITTVSVHVQIGADGTVTLIDASGSRIQNHSNPTVCHQPPNETQSTVVIGAVVTVSLSGGFISGGLTGLDFQPFRTGGSDVEQTKGTSISNRFELFNDCFTIELTSSFVEPHPEESGVAFSSSAIVGADGRLSGFDFSQPEFTETFGTTTKTTSFSGELR